jgi:hypothetical protein
MDRLQTVPAIGAVPFDARDSGLRDAEVLVRDKNGEVAFVTLTRADSVQAIRAFAGEDHERPVIEPTARTLLSRYDERAHHYSPSSFRP